MTGRRWAMFLSLALFAGMVGIGVIYGGTECAVPKSGPFHWLMKGQHWVVTKGRASGGCMRVK